jgi:hypothetical protein
MTAPQELKSLCGNKRLVFCLSSPFRLLSFAVAFAFRCHPEERSDEGSLFMRQFEHTAAAAQRLLGGRSVRVYVPTASFRQGTDLSMPKMLANRCGFSR